MELASVDLFWSPDDSGLGLFLARSYGLVYYHIVCDCKDIALSFIQTSREMAT